MKTTLKIMVLFISILLTSCNANLNIGNTIDGSGNVITEKRNITDTFTKINASTGVEVMLEQGNTTEIVVEIDDNLMKYVITKVENGTLIAKIDGNITTTEAIIIRIKTAEIDGLEASSGASIRSKNTLKGTNIAVETSSGSLINADLEYEKVVSEASSGSEITLSGKALIVETSSSSGSTINAKDLAANEITAESSSGSNTTVNPIVFLNAKASSGSTIEYIKDAKKIIKKEGSGGSIFKK
jgi:predicted small secreted protein